MYYTDVCADAICEQMCIKTPTGSAKCLCKKGYYLNEDGDQCEGIEFCL